MKMNWVKKQIPSFNNLNPKNVSDAKVGKSWIKGGLIWGLFMFTLTTFLFPLFDGTEITWRKILIGIPLWTVVGLGLGYTLKKFMH